MNHIVVIGFMGSGKTRVETSVSDLGLTFVDVDKVIVKKMNMSVRRFYRNLETILPCSETMTVKALIEDKERKSDFSWRRSSRFQEQNEQYIKQLDFVVLPEESAETLRKEAGK